jgi:hypothetical protein
LRVISCMRTNFTGQHGEVCPGCYIHNLISMQM